MIGRSLGGGVGTCRLVKADNSFATLANIASYQGKHYCDDTWMLKTVVRLKPPAWQIILFAAAVGPLFGMLLLLVPFWVRSWEAVRVLLAMGYVFGLVPSVVGGILFSILRYRFGSGFRCAGFSGGCATALCAAVVAYSKQGPFSGLEMLSSPIFYIAGICGVFPALGTRLLAQYLAPNAFKKPSS